MKNITYQYIFNFLTLLFLLFGTPNPLLGEVNQEITILQKKLENLPSGEKKINTLNELGEKLRHEDYELAKKYNQEAQTIAEQIAYQPGIGEAKRNLGLIAIKTGEKEQALQLIEQALVIAQQNKLKSLEAKATWSLGSYWSTINKSPKAIQYLLQSKKLFTELKDNYWLILCYIQLGWSYHEKGNHEQTETYFQQAITEAEKGNFKKLLTEALYGISGIYLNRGIKNHLVFSNLERGLKIALAHNQPRHAAQIQMALGGLYYSLGEKSKAKSYYLTALSYFKSINLYSLTSRLYRDLGVIAMEEKEYDIALGYCNAALNIIDKVTNKNTHVNIYLTLGNIYINRDKDYNKALTFFKRSLDLGQERTGKYTFRQIELHIGDAYLNLGQFQKAVNWCKEGLAKSNVSLQLSVKGCKCLASAYDNLGEDKTALNYYQQLTVLKDSLHQEELSVQINNLEMRENYEKEVARIKQTQAIEEEQRKTKMAWTIGGLLLLFMTAILFLSIAYIRRSEQKNQLVALAKLRQEMIANVSHDLRTPIAVMQGYVETLLMKINSTSSTDREKYLNIILNSSERLSLLISQLFEFSKLETQQIQLQKEPFLIEELLTSSLEEYQVLAKKKDIQLVMDCPENSPAIYADISLIERVIQNLMDNALKFTPEKGKINVTIAGDDKEVKISIADTGSGITKEQQSKIFNRYEKTKNSTGAGLGLAIVKKILALHKGIIHVKSEQGKGTQFIFSLPTHKIYN